MIDKTSIIKTLELENMTHSDQMEVLDSIEKTIKESKVRQKEQLQTNVDFVVQALKGIKQDLEERFSRLDNKLVGKVDNILSGKDGLPGKDGMPGRDGRAGRDGEKGADGRNGEDGKDGVGVSKAKVDIDGELVITLTDGRIIEAGKVFTKAVAEKIRVFSNMDNRIPELVGQSGKILSNDGVNVIWTYNVPITIKDEGTSITTAVKSINFVGATVTATDSNQDVTVNVSAGTGTVTSVGLSGGTTGLTVTGSPITTSGTITLGGTLDVDNGGTGQTSYTDGQLLIGNSTGNTLTKTTLTAGSGRAITNGSGSISIAATNSGTVTSVAATVPSFLSVAGSPITTSGTLAITLSGTALPIANGGTGATTLAGASIATYSGTETLTNKRIDPRVTSAASASTLTPDISVSDVYAYTALAATLTINAPIGTPLDGDKLIFRLLDNGTGRTLTWNATYTVIGVTLPTTTTANKTTYVGCIYNANNTRWDVIAVTTQA